GEGAAVEDGIELEAEHVGRVLGIVLQADVAALAQQVEGEDRTLPGVDPVFLDEVEALGQGHTYSVRNRELTGHSAGSLTLILLKGGAATRRRSHEVLMAISRDNLERPGSPCDVHQPST